MELLNDRHFAKSIYICSTTLNNWNFCDIVALIVSQIVSAYRYFDYVKMERKKLVNKTWQ